MKILKVIHGYPPAYNAGSEVYSQMLCHGLSEKHTVSVLTREENPFKPAFSHRLSSDEHKPNIKIHLVNIPGENYRYSYRNAPLDRYCQEVIDELKPDVVHIGHLNHLSVSLLEVFAKNNLPIIYTLHDYWLMCPRGQFIKRNPEGSDCWKLCEKQVDEDCASHCYSGYFSGASEDHQEDHRYWTSWVNRRMQYVKKLMPQVDLFLAPSQYLLNRYVKDFVIPEDKIQYLDYGFDMNRYHSQENLIAKKTDKFTFGYIGTHIPSKGIQLLLQAFSDISHDAKLIIWGKPRGYNTEALKRQCEQLPAQKRKNVEWRDEYANENIVADVFQHIDCLVVPSIWVENSPLVIHEAQQARLPIITANTGGMSEYVEDNVNGLLFNHRDADSLSNQMQKLASSPSLAEKLSSKGYLYSDSGNIPSMENHVKDIEELYHSILIKKSIKEFA